MTSAFIARASKKQQFSATTKPRPSPSNDPPTFANNGTISSTSLHSNEGSEDQYPSPTIDPEVREQSQ